jgi:two-component system, chemotaxis family, protein-glutamate methylesterase/glutaminase
MLVERDVVRVVHAPKENLSRPAIDSLFRSAGRTYRNRMIGVVLTGALDDGTAGLHAIKRYGGLAIVQDPQEALYPSMPQSTLGNVKVDYVLPLAEIGAELGRLVHHQTVPEMEAPDVVGGLKVSTSTSMHREAEDKKELQIVENGTALDGDDHPGTPSPYSCLGCGGVLWEIQEGAISRYRCRVGHAYSVGSMQIEQSEAVERALWVALKTLEESASLAERMALSAHGRNQEWLAGRYEEKASDARENAAVIQNLLLKRERELPDGTWMVRWGRGE